MNDKKTTRRRFLVATMTLAGCASGTLSPSMLRLSSAWADTGGRASGETLNAMVQMARLLFPHDAMSDEFYGQVLDAALSATASNHSFAAVLDAAEQALNTARRHDWLDLDEGEQLAVMREVQDQGFFAAIEGNVRAGIYLNPVFWKHIGYPGSSKEFGGYINRGSGDIDWLPEGS